MRLWFLSVAMVGLNLMTACSQLALTRPPQAAPITGAETEMPPASSDAGAPADVVEDIKSILSAETGIPSYDLLLVSTEAVEWSDACLGLAAPDELCAQVITPGYRVVLSSLDRHYVYHTDQTGTNIRRAETTEL